MYAMLFFLSLFSYFSQLSDSGHKMGVEVRHSYHQLVLMLVEAVQSFSNLNEKWVSSSAAEILCVGSVV